MSPGFEVLHRGALRRRDSAARGMDESSAAPKAFGAGTAAKHVQVPGTAESAAFQASLRDASATTATPSVETPGYFRMSLRDRAAGRASQIRVALDKNVRAPCLAVTEAKPASGTWQRRKLE